MTKSLNITEKMVLGTAQFGMDYGITNLSGQPSKQEAFDIIELAWENGVRRFDTAPGYGSEDLLGEFIANNGVEREAILLTKLSGLKEGDDYKSVIKSSLESSLKKLDCKIEVLFFHDPKDSELLMNNPSFFESLLDEYPVSTLGVSVYEPHQVEKLWSCGLELAFQFPFNVLDRRFENKNIPKGKRYARSVFLQGLLASPIGLRNNAPRELVKFQKYYHDILSKYFINPISFSISFVAMNDSVDYFLIGVDSQSQLQELLELNLSDNIYKIIINENKSSINQYWLDPRNWS